MKNLKTIFSIVILFIGVNFVSNAQCSDDGIINGCGKTLKPGFTYLKVYDVAIEHYTNAIRLEPKYIDAYYNRALCYEQLDEPKKAVADLKIALELNPQYTPAALLMGRVLKNNE